MTKPVQQSPTTTTSTFDQAPRFAPGPVIPKATIRLHTHIAHQLFFGRDGQQRRGRTQKDPCFKSFAAQLGILWDLAVQDDPYADARLLFVEDHITTVRASLQGLHEKLDTILSGLADSGIQVEAPEALRPVDVPISFRATQAAVAIQLLGKLDQAIRKALTARHFGLVTPDDWQQVLARSARPMRKLFMSTRFYASGATRDDFAANNARAGSAAERFGTLAADVLSGERRPALGPALGPGLNATRSDSVRE